MQASFSNDVAVIGAGPCGLFQVFELGLLGLGAEVIESLPQPGGQCTELYPDKPIYDIPAVPVCTGQELTDNLLRQVEPFGSRFHYNSEVQSIDVQADGRFLLRTATDQEFTVGAVVIAAGAGSFQPMPLRAAGAEQELGNRLFYRIKDKELHVGKHLVIAGGGDSALDWALELVHKAASLTLVHRSDNFRAQPASVARMRALCDKGTMRTIVGNISSLELDRGKVVVANLQTGREEAIVADHVLCFFGLAPKPGPISDWALAMHKNQLVVDTEQFQTSRKGIFAVGDVNYYPGKKKLILSGFHEAALAAFAIKRYLYPDAKLHLQYTTTSPALHKRLGIV